MIKPIAPCIWFDNNAEEAVKLYASVFKNVEVLHVDRYSDVGPDLNASVVVIEFTINGQPFQALNGGPHFKLSEAVSFTIECEDQEEIDYYWNSLTEGGEPSQCGWLKDPFGVSWQVYPTVLNDLLRDADRERAGRVMRRMLEMQKIEISELQAAYDQ